MNSLYNKGFLCWNFKYIVENWNFWKKVVFFIIALESSQFAQAQAVPGRESVCG